MRLLRDDCTACSSSTTFPQVQSLLRPVCDDNYNILRGLGSDTQKRVVDEGIPDTADNSASDSGPKVCPVAFMPQHVENLGSLVSLKVLKAVNDIFVHSFHFGQHVSLCR
jgi:hypothetical protein